MRTGPRRGSFQRAPRAERIGAGVPARQSYNGTLGLLGMCHRAAAHKVGPTQDITTYRAIWRLFEIIQAKHHNPDHAEIYHKKDVASYRSRAGREFRKRQHRLTSRSKAQLQEVFRK